MKYKKSLGCSLTRSEGNFYIITGSRELFEINELGARIFDLCNGANTIDDIIDKLFKMFDVDKIILKNDVNDFIKTLIDNKIIV